jgi:hypothetical protein
MNWDAIGAIGRAISALALVVVIVQVRLSAAETLRFIRQSRMDDERRTLSENAQSEWLSGDSVAPATPIRRVQVDWDCASAYPR